MTDFPQALVTEADTALANRCVPAAAIFADNEEHIADMRRRAALHIANSRLASTKALREALEPFLNAAEPVLYNDRERWQPDEWTKRLKKLTVGDFRQLHRAALASGGSQ